MTCTRRLFTTLLLVVSLDIGSAYAAENILPPSTREGKVQDKSLIAFEQLGDADLPKCKGRTLRRLGNGSQNPYKWTVTSEIGSGSTVYPGREWQVTFTVDHWHGGIADNGIDPLRLRLLPLGPAGSGAPPSGIIPKPSYYNAGSSPTGPVGPFGSWGYEFDGNSRPMGLFEVGDGVSAKLTITIRADAPGVISLPQAELSGYDDTPIAGSIDCDPMLVNMFWNVEEPQALIASADFANTDARYNNLDIDAATSGSHIIKIDVIANDDDPSIPGGPGDLNQVRIQDWDTVSLNGGIVGCGIDAQKGLPLTEPLANVGVGLCVYQAPLGFSGTDQFNYVIRGVVSGGSATTANGVVVVKVLANTPPQIAPPSFGTAAGVDQTFDLNPNIADPQGDPYICIPDGPASGAGTATVNANCSLDWDNTSPAFTGNVTVPFKVCDTHPTIDGGQLGQNVVRGFGYPDGDLSATQSRRCNTNTATIAILNGLKLPPTGVSDSDIVDAGYAADGIGSYSLSIPVLDNDTDGNGPNPSMPSASPVILIPPPVNEGTASFIGDKLIFTPADGFSGEVSMTYRVCEDPAAQAPPYSDDPNTPKINEGLPVCGVGAVTIQVLGNEPPVAGLDETSIASTSLLSGFDLSLNDSDPDGESLVCTAGIPLASDPSLVDSASVSANCKLSFNPVDEMSGVVEFSYEVCDQHPLTTPLYPASPYGSDGLEPGDMSSRCSTGVAAITVTANTLPEVNPLDDDPLPICNADGRKTDIDTPISIDVIANDSDLNKLLQSAAVILTGPPQGDPLVTAQGGSAEMNGVNTVLYTPALGFFGTDSFSYTARDLEGQPCMADVTVKVGNAVAVPSLGGKYGLIALALLLAALGARLTRSNRFWEAN